MTAMKTFDNTRPLVAAMALGIGRAAYEHAREFVKEQLRDGAPDAALRGDRRAPRARRPPLEAARMITWRAASDGRPGEPNAKEASMCKAAGRRSRHSRVHRGDRVCGAEGCSRRRTAPREVVPRHQGLRHLRGHRADPAGRDLEAPLCRSQGLLMRALSQFDLAAVFCRFRARRRRAAGAKRRCPPTRRTSAPSALLPVQIVNKMAGCDDSATCERECDAGAGDRCRRPRRELRVRRGGRQGRAEVDCLVRARVRFPESRLGREAAGRMYEFHAEPKDYAKAAHFYERSCAIGWQGGCANYAITLESGRGVEKDCAKARALLGGVQGGRGGRVRPARRL